MGANARGARNGVASASLLPSEGRSRGSLVSFAISALPPFTTLQPRWGFYSRSKGFILPPTRALRERTLSAQAQPSARGTWAHPATLSGPRRPTVLRRLPIPVFTIGCIADEHAQGCQAV